MNGQATKFTRVEIRNGFQVTVLCSDHHLFVSGDQAMKMTLDEHAEALTLCCITQNIEPPAQAQCAVSFEGGVIQALELQLECTTSDAQGVVMACEDSLVTLSKAGHTACQVARLMLNPEEESE